MNLMLLAPLLVPCSNQLSWSQLISDGKLRAPKCPWNYMVILVQLPVPVWWSVISPCLQAGVALPWWVTAAQGWAGPKGYLAEKIIHVLLFLFIIIFVSFSFNGILAIHLRDVIPVLLTNPSNMYSEERFLSF